MNLMLVTETRATQLITYFTTSTAARELNTSEANVRKLATAGRLPFIRTENGHRLFRPEDVRRLAIERRGAR